VTISVAVIIALAAVVALMVFDKSPDLLNSEFRVIVTNSMDGEPTEYDISTIPVNSLVAIHKMDGGSTETVHIGDVIGFRSETVHGNVYHRVINIDPTSQIFTTKGDNTHSTESIPFGDVNGKVVNVSPLAGQAITYLQKNTLFVLAVIIILVVMVEAVSYVLRLGKE